MVSRPLLCLILGTAFWFLTPAPVHAELQISGGTAFQQESLRHVYNQFPVCCQNSCTICVMLLDDAAMNSYLKRAEGAQASQFRNDAVDGLYQNSITTIALRIKSATSEVFANFAHEYGHFVWSRLLTNQQRIHYELIYQYQSDTHHLVTPYAAVSVNEGFAEAYCYYNCQKQLLRQCDALSYSFLDQYFKIR